MGRTSVNHVRVRRMPSSAIRVFTDPDDYASAIRQGASEVTVTGRGRFDAEIIRIDFERLWMQRLMENTGRIKHTQGLGARAVIAFPDSDGTRTVLERYRAHTGGSHTPQGRGQLLSALGRGCGICGHVAAGY